MKPSIQKPALIKKSQRTFKGLFSFFIFVLVAITAPASTVIAAEKGASGLPLPRFVSMSAHELNMRTGPGLQYPVEWSYRLKGLPLQIIAEFKTWRKVLDWDGSQGWVHQNMLAAKRTFIIVNGPQTIFSKADMAAPAVARAETGVVGELISCLPQNSWCRVNADGFEGWLKPEGFWGIMKGEALN